MLGGNIERGDGDIINQHDWYREQQRRQQEPIRGIGLTVQPTSDAKTVCGRLIDSSVNVNGLGGIPITPNSVNVGDLQGTAYVAPTYQGGSFSATSVGTVAGLLQDVNVSVIVNNVPQTGDVARVLWSFRKTGTTAWIPWAETTMPNLPSPGASQTITFGYGQLSNGISYDFGAAFVSVRGDVGATSAFATNYTPTSNAIAIPSNYLLAGAAYTPTIAASPTFTNTASPNGLTAATTVNFTITNQPTDGSLSRVSLFYRLTGATNWSFYGSVASVGLGSGSPPSSGAYSFTYADLSNGTAYDFGFACENAQGGETSIVFVLTNTATTVQIPVASLSAMPAGIKSAGPTISASSLGTAVNTNGAAVSQPINVTIGDWSAGANPSWFAGLRVFIRAHGDATAANWQVIGDLPANASALTYATSADIAAGIAWDIGVAYLGVNPNDVSTVVWPAALNTTAVQIGGGALSGGDPSDVDQTIFETDPVAGTGVKTIKFKRAPGAVKKTHNANGQLLMSEFPGGTQNTDGSFTNVDGELSTTRVLTNSTVNGNVVTCRAVISKGAVGNQAYILLGDITGGNYYYLYFLTNGHIGISKAAAGVGYNLADQAITDTTATKTYQLSVQFNAANNVVEGIIDGVTFGPFVDSTNIPSMPSPAGIVIATGGASGKLYDFELTSGQNAHTAMPTGIKSAINSNGDLLTTDFPGQTKLMQSGPYAGWQQCTGSQIKDTKGYTLVSSSMNWLWTEWYVVNSTNVNSVSTGMGPGFFDNAGNYLQINLYNNGGNTLYNGTVDSNANLYANPAYNTTANPKAATYRLGLQAATGSQARLVLFINDQLCLDHVFNVPFVANSPIFPAFFSDPPHTQIYVKSFSASGGVDGMGSSDVYLGSRPRKNLIVNGANCAGTAALAPTAFGWIPYSGTPLSQINANGTYMAAGTASAMTTINVYGNNSAGIYQIIPVKPGSTYTYMAMLNEDSGAQAHLGIYDAGGVVAQINGSPTTPLGSIPSSYQQNGSSGVDIGNSPSVAGQWRAVCGTFTVPSSNTADWKKVMVLFRQLSGTLGNVYGTMFQVFEGNRLQDYIDHEGNFGSVTYDKHTTGNLPNSSMFNKYQGSLLNVAGTPVYSYSSTTTSITLSIPASTYTRTDQSTVSVASYAYAYNGLTASTTYHFNIWYDVINNVFGSASYGTTAPTSAQKLADCYKDGRIPIYTDYQVATPASGTGGGSSPPPPGGGGCPAEYQPILTRDRGFVRADELNIGDFIASTKNDGWVEVRELTRLPAPLWRYTITDGVTVESFDVNDTHALKNPSGEWIKVRDLLPGMELAGERSDLTVVDAHYIADGYYIALEVDTHEYSMGMSLVHNPITL